MSIKIPLSVNYPSALVSLPAVWWNEKPTEGAKYIPVTIDWATMGGTNKTVAVNANNNPATPNAMSQIAALAIDNSDCGADVTFIWPDTQMTITIPAYSPYDVVPVFSQATSFFVSAVGETLSTDETRFLILNTMPPPIAVPTSQEQETAFDNDIAVANGTTQLVPTTISGTLESLSVFYSFLPNALQGEDMWIIEDGTGKQIAAGQGVQSGGTTPAVNVLGYNTNNLRVRFSQGLKIVQTVTGTFTAGSVLAVNLAYRLP